MRLLVVWLLLCAITLVYLGLDHSSGDDTILSPSAAVTAAAIGMALVKVRIIMREFMDVRHAPLLLRVLTDAWVVIMGVGMLTTYVVGRAVA